jgi:hypothetical protein
LNTFLIMFLQVPSIDSTIAKFPRPSSHTSNTVDKLNKSKSSGLVNVPRWCCHWYAGGAAAVAFIWQWMMLSLTTVMAVEAVAARRQWQRWRWRQWTMIGGKSG